MNNEKPSHLFVLPNGSHLSYAFPRDKGNQYAWKKSWDIPIVRGWNVKSKEGQIKVGLWSSRSNQHVIAVDIDKLPAGYSSFTDVRNYLANFFGDRAIVATSFSGKAKAFVVIQFPHRVRCNGKIALHCLNCILPPDLFKEADKHVSALSITYANLDIINKLSMLHTVKPYLINELMSNANLELVSKSVCYKKNEKNVSYSESELVKNISSPFPIWDGCFPAELRAQFKLKGRPVKEMVLRKLLSIRELTTKEGFGLPCTRIGRELETCHTNVSYWLRGWIDDGVLECIDDKYNFVSVRSFANATAKAKQYRFKGPALLFAQTLRATSRRDILERQIRIPDSRTSMKDGKAYKEIFAAACKFRNPSQFWNYILSRPNITKKDRLRMAKNAIAYFCPDEKRRNIRELISSTSE